MEPYTYAIKDDKGIFEENADYEKIKKEYDFYVRGENYLVEHYTDDLTQGLYEYHGRFGNVGPADIYDYANLLKNDDYGYELFGNVSLLRINRNTKEVTIMKQFESVVLPDGRFGCITDIDKDNMATVKVRNSIYPEIEKLPVNKLKEHEIAFFMRTKLSNVIEDMQTWLIDNANSIELAGSILVDEMTRYNPQSNEYDKHWEIQVNYTRKAKSTMPVPIDKIETKEPDIEVGGF